MLNAIWMGMIVLSFAGALMTGNLTALSKAAADGAQNAVTTALLLLGAMCLWLGMMNIAREAGVRVLIGLDAHEPDEIADPTQWQLAEQELAPWQLC